MQQQRRQHFGWLPFVTSTSSRHSHKYIGKLNSTLIVNKKNCPAVDFRRPAEPDVYQHPVNLRLTAIS